MRAVVQRVRSARVTVGEETVGEIGPGLAILLGVGRGDGAEHGERLAAKIAALRIFVDADGKMNRSVGEAGGGVLVIPQFTLHADVRRGRRPGFGAAAEPEEARRLYEAFCGLLRAADLPVSTGRFGAYMVIELVADGPVTIVVSTDGWAEGAVGA
ncbi:MAG: D-tyrosyl-tRNA(Tyr) deacylase [Chloroflexi bacterium]|nr:D-tyrosyl-tRNA(Tyr) deacylase [Chloroflexota bacterium]